MFPKIINASKRHNRLICFLMFDVDFFKPYNDTYGHQKGDETLIKIADATQATLRRVEDLAFRLGGEEFGVLYEANSLADAKNLAYTLN
ncbi:MAG: GGDEF domain-containing protein [Sulfurimonas sp.]|nr:GGDEF domain-containing protein [Sulfurimonas sp.]